MFCAEYPDNRTCPPRCNWACWTVNLLIFCCCLNPSARCCFPRHAILHELLVHDCVPQGCPIIILLSCHLICDGDGGRMWRVQVLADDGAAETHVGPPVQAVPQTALLSARSARPSLLLCSPHSLLLYVASQPLPLLQPALLLSRCCRAATAALLRCLCRADGGGRHALRPENQPPFAWRPAAAGTARGTACEAGEGEEAEGRAGCAGDGGMDPDCTLLEKRRAGPCPRDSKRLLALSLLGARHARALSQPPASISQHSLLGARRPQERR